MMNAHDTAVPAEDSAADVTTRDTVGKKSDTVSGTSLISRAKIAEAAIAVVDGFHDVPVADVATNAQMRDAVGNKDDTVSGTSLVALTKVANAALVVVDGYHDVPATDAATNAQMRDVVGNKADRLSSAGAVDKSMYAILYGLYDHVHKPQKVYPTLDDGNIVTADEAVWTLGVFKELVPVNGITKQFDIHYVNVENASAVDVYEIVLYAVEVEIGRCRFTKSAAQDVQAGVPIQVPIQAANVQIQAKVACAGGSSRTVTISLSYHEY